MLYAGLKVAGINGEVAPGQWEYQIGITRGIECGDHMWLARYIMGRVGEKYGVDCDFEPKPVKGNFFSMKFFCLFLNFFWNLFLEKGWIRDNSI
jgi:glutamine synthetase